MHNVNALTKEACLNLTGDETRWGHQGWGEPQSGMVRWVREDRLFFFLMLIGFGLALMFIDTSFGRDQRDSQ